MSIEELEHTADLRFRIRAPTLEGLFAEAVRALMETLFGNSNGPAIAGTRTVEVSAADREGLLHDLLSEILYRSETENLVFSGTEISLADGPPLSVRAELRATPFDPDMTFPRPFTAPSGQIEADSMAETLHVAYAEQDGWEAIALPYSEGFTSIVILPPGGSDPLAEGPEAVAARVESLKAALEAAAAEETVVQLPVLELSNTPALEPALERAGLGAIFTGDGNPFAAISAAEQLFVSQASQQGVLIMNEEGTTAAAVTELGMEATSAPGGEPREFIVDRPYLLTISQNETGWDLFQAVIRNPAEQ